VIRQPVSQAACEAIDPEMSVRIEHHFADSGILEISRNLWSERGTQHLRTAGKGFGSGGNRRHCAPRKFASSRRIDQQG